MRLEHRKRVHKHMRVVLGWPIWKNNRPALVAFILVVGAGYLAAIVAAVLALPTPVPLRDLGLCAALLACSAATVELTKRAGENIGLVRDVYAVWELPLAILLPPVYALVVPIFRFGLTEGDLRLQQSRIPTADGQNVIA